MSHRFDVRLAGLGGPTLAALHRWVAPRTPCGKIGLVLVWVVHPLTPW